MNESENLGDDPTDMSPERIEYYRQMTIDEKWMLIGQLYRDRRDQFEAEELLRNPSATPKEITLAWMNATLEPALIKEMQDAGAI